MDIGAIIVITNCKMEIMMTINHGRIPAPVVDFGTGILVT